MARALPTTIERLDHEHRKIQFVFDYKNMPEKKASLQHNILLRKSKEVVEREKFLDQWQIELPQSDVVGSDAITAISSGISHWAEHASFYVCSQCNSILPVKMPYNFLRKPIVSKRTKCQCLTERYIVPAIDNIPKELLNLSIHCVNALRPFHINCGVYKRQAHGYRVKTGMMELFPSPTSVADKIRNLPDRCDRQKCRIAYNYLIASNHSSYSHFVHLREELLQNQHTFNCFDFEITAGIECALWPNLYPFTSWCESTICGKDSRQSSKIAFCTKLFSEIVDYGLHFDLLQWQVIVVFIRLLVEPLTQHVSPTVHQHAL